MSTICNHKGYNSSFIEDLHHKRITVIDQEKIKEKNLRKRLKLIAFLYNRSKISCDMHEAFYLRQITKYNLHVTNYKVI